VAAEMAALFFAYGTICLSPLVFSKVHINTPGGVYQLIMCLKKVDILSKVY
jgi:hypothetical protein